MRINHHQFCLPLSVSGLHDTTHHNPMLYVTGVCFVLDLSTLISELPSYHQSSFSCASAYVPTSGQDGLVNWIRLKLCSNSTPNRTTRTSSQPHSSKSSAEWKQEAPTRHCNSRLMPEGMYSLIIALTSKEADPCQGCPEGQSRMLISRFMTHSFVITAVHHQPILCLCCQRTECTFLPLRELIKATNPHRYVENFFPPYTEVTLADFFCSELKPYTR